MLTVTKTSPDRVDIVLSGALDAAAMRAGLDELIRLSEGVRHGRMLYRITDFSMPTLGAIGVELGRLPRLFALVSRFDRCAVISDVAWLRRAAEIEGALIPGLEIKSFDLPDAAAAEAWLSGSRATPG
jgi:SpoIIAA-like